jgi:hypothetical protein
LSGLLDEVVNCLIKRLRRLPPIGEDTRGTQNRAATVSNLARKLEGLTSAPYGRR